MMVYARRLKAGAKQGILCERRSCRRKQEAITTYSASGACETANDPIGVGLVPQGPIWNPTKIINAHIWDRL